MPFDYDTAMVNQVMFTFKRQSGYMFNNRTSERWSWKESEYAKILRNPKYDYQGLVTTGYIVNPIYRFNMLLGLIFGYGILSIVNALVIRVALVSSNVVIFPMLWFVKLMTG